MMSTRRSVAICTERVEAKRSVRAVWSPTPVAICTERVEAKLSWRRLCVAVRVAICTERVEAKENSEVLRVDPLGCNLHGACGGKVSRTAQSSAPHALQSARSVWRQSQS